MEKLVKKDTWVCYFLRSSDPLNNGTYIGCTNDMQNRLRQHNREIVGGAKATAKLVNCEIFCIITGFDSRSVACKYEWMFKHPDGKRRCSRKYAKIEGKIKGVNDLFNTDYFKSKNLILPTTIYIKDDVSSHLWYNNIPESVHIYIC